MARYVGRCEICHRFGPLDHDHDHAPWVTRDEPWYWRGWLCHPCNIRLGYWECRGLFVAAKPPDVMTMQARSGRPLKDPDWFFEAWMYLGIC